MAHKFKEGDRVVANRATSYCSKGHKAVLLRDDNSDSPLFELGNGSEYFINECFFDLDAITFDQLFERFRKYLLQDTKWVNIGDQLRAYRSSDSYLSITVDGVDLSFHGSNRERITSSKTCQVHAQEALRLLDEYEAKEAPVEMTIAEIADKLGIDSKKLKIKE